ncbi:MAG: glycosyltransferase family 2 protein [Flavobacteriales bacterium]
MTLSVVVITFNEERNIQRCLQSVKELADEVVVVDSFSTDRTKAICLENGVKFIEHAFEGHIQQKNWAWNQASCDFVLSLDADEALTPELKESIAKVKENPKFNGYTLNRLTYYCGHWVKHSGWYPDTKLRLFKKGDGEWGGVNPHDKFMMNQAQETPNLNGDLLHYSYYSKEDHFKQIEYFSAIAAQELHKSGKRVSTFTIGLKMLAQFVKNYILKRGFLDGRTGWLIAIRSSYATLRKYSKLKELYEKGS